MVYVENELIGRRLKLIRTELGLNYFEMAEILEISDGHYRKIERGIYGLDAKKLLLLNEKLNVDPLYILTGSRGMEVQYVTYSQSGHNDVVGSLLEYCRQYLMNPEEE